MDSNTPLTIYLGIKYYADQSNRPLIEAITRRLQRYSWSTICIARDLEQWGQKSFTPEALMQQTFQIIEQSDIVVLEMSEKGVGLGIEAGYAYASGKPIVVLLAEDRPLSTTLSGIASHVIRYTHPAHIDFSSLTSIK